MTEFPAYQAPPPHRSRPGPPAESLRSRSTGVVILVAVAACVNVLISAATAIDWTPEPYAQSGRNPLNFWSVLLYLAAGLAFIEWERRARENMERLGDQRPRWAIGWTRGGWLIPGLNLVIPILVLREIDKASAQAAVAARQQESQGWKTPAGDSPVFIMWAVFWTVNNVAGLAGLLTSGRTALAADITSLIAELGAGVAAILLVLQITDNQEQARKLQAPQSSYDWAMAGIQGYSPPPDEPPASPALQAAPAPEIWTDAGA